MNSKKIYIYMKEAFLS